MMTNWLSAILILGMSVMASAQDFLDYAEAYKRSQVESKPLLVYVSASWCAPCQKMKREVLVPLRDQGVFRKIVVGVVDRDAHPAIADAVMGGGALPCLAVYAQVNGEWSRKKLHGYQTQDMVRGLLRPFTSGR